MASRFLLLEEAAHRWGATPDEVQRWIDEGLLSVFTEEQVSPRQPSGSAPPGVKVDEDELLELAETIGWLRLSAAAMGPGLGN